MQTHASTLRIGDGEGSRGAGVVVGGAGYLLAACFAPRQPHCAPTLHGSILVTNVGIRRKAGLQFLGNLGFDADAGFCCRMRFFTYLKHRSIAQDTWRNGTP